MLSALLFDIAICFFKTRKVPASLSFISERETRFQNLLLSGYDVLVHFTSPVKPLSEEISDPETVFGATLDAKMCSYPAR